MFRWGAGHPVLPFSRCSDRQAWISRAQPRSCRGISDSNEETDPALSCGMHRESTSAKREVAGFGPQGGSMKFLIGTFLWALALIAVCEKVDVYRTGYAIEQLRAEKKQAQHEQRALELELARVTAPEQIER